MASSSSTYARSAIAQFLRAPKNTFRRVGMPVLDERFPESYKKERHELETQEPIPVHWIPEPGKFTKHPKYGTITRVQNIPIPVKYPQESNQGLWGGEGVIKGFLKKYPRKRRFATYWFPVLQKKILYSEILDRYMLIIVTPRALNLIDEAYGLDYYILKTHPVDLKSKLGMDLRREMLFALIRKDFYHDDPVKQEKIYNKYKEFIIPEEEVEWVGLSLLEAGEKLRDEYKTEPKPLKVTYAEELIKRLQETNENDEEAEKSWLSRFNPFAEDTKK